MKLDNLNDVLVLFDQINGKGTENCIFFAQKDQAQICERGSVTKAVAKEVANNLTFGISGLVGKLAEAGKSTPLNSIQEELNLDILNNYTQFLINETENSIAIIPILFKGVLHWKTEGAQFFPESGRVIPKSVIEKIEIGKFSILTPTVRGIRIKLIDGYKLEFMGITNVKTLPYHIENFKKFNNKYKI